MRFVSSLLFALVLAGGIVVLGGCAATHGAGATKNPDARAQFERMKGLAGQWTSTGGSAGAGAKVSYKLVSNGSALMEDLFVGSPHEMLTMYHMDGDALVLTHYCAMGNQPTMRAEPTAADGGIKFVCFGGTNLHSKKDPHMHEGVLWLVDPNHIKSMWTVYELGEAKDSVEIELARDGSS